MVFTIGDSEKGKTMSFREDHGRGDVRQASVRLDHGSFVTLSQEGGGVIESSAFQGRTKHRVTHAARTKFFAVNLVGRM